MTAADINAATVASSWNFAVGQRVYITLKIEGRCLATIYGTAPSANGLGRVFLLSVDTGDSRPYITHAPGHRLETALWS